MDFFNKLECVGGCGLSVDCHDPMAQIGGVICDECAPIFLSQPLPAGQPYVFLTAGYLESMTMMYSQRR